MRTMNWRQRGLVGLFAASSAVAIVAGCGQHGGAGGGGGSPTGSPTATTPIASPTWSPSTSCTPLLPAHLSVFQAQIFNGGCLGTAFASCHTGTNPSANYSMASNLTLVESSNAASSEIPAMKRIVPGSKATSYFYLKLINDPVIDTAPFPSFPMPNTGVPLSQCSIDAIGAWIDAGALND
jgi:hypothetical protein